MGRSKAEIELKNQRARRLRREMTFPEQKLWWHVRNRGLAGLKFRRQHPIGKYFADFACVEPMIVIEIDGDSHEGQYLYDMQRELFIKQQGFKVIRVGNDDVLHDIDCVLNAILLAANVDPTLMS